MDLTQATQLLTWLDEEHRRDKALLLELRQRVEAQYLEITDQARRIQELEGRLAQTQTQLTKFHQIEETLRQLREELILLVQSHEEAHRKADQERAKARQLERESLMRAVNELRRDLEALLPLPDRLKAMQEEDQRLADRLAALFPQLNAVQRAVNEHGEKFTFAETQRINDQKKLGQLQQDVLEIWQRVESHSAKVELVEEIARRNEQNIATLAALREELRREYDRWVEAAKQREAARDQILQKWAQELQAFEELARRQRATLEQIHQHREHVRQALRQLEEFKQEIERAVNLIAEKQRLAEDRQRHQLEEWVAEQEQRWRKFELERQAKWNHLDVRQEEVVARIKALESYRQESSDRVAQLARELIALQEEYRAKIVELWRIQEQVLAAEVEAVRRRFQMVAEELQKRIGGE
ncbi:MAG: hypothetical protein Q9O62_09005 [Ardenticatenia bacterium]|nr:hypothetical protein [Ardenticatenia bacterium]